MEGKDIRKVMADTPDLVKSLGQRLAGIQAEIHSLDWQPLVVGTDLEISDDPAAYQVARWSQIVLDNAVAAEPMLAFAIDWLQQHKPENITPCLIHGDFKANNLLFDKRGHVAVIDWELAHIGDPYEDLAFTLLWTTRFDIVGGMLSPDQYLTCYSNASGKNIDYKRLHYWQVFSWLKLAGIFLKGYSENSSDKVEKPARIMLLRAIPWINYQLAKLLSNTTYGKAK
jgi:aminoglycoside phosphotransferase (APT) family kinase protein